MLNLVGDPFDPWWLSLDGVHMHWYGKSVRPGRKLGHVNVTARDAAGLSARLNVIGDSVPGRGFPEFTAAQRMAARCHS